MGWKIPIPILPPYQAGAPIAIGLQGSGRPLENFSWDKYDLLLSQGVVDLILHIQGIVLWCDDSTAGAIAQVQFDEDPYAWQIFAGHRIYQRFQKITLNATAQTNGIMNLKWTNNPEILRIGSW